MPINVLITKDYDELSEKAAEIIAKAIRDNPSLVLGLATGDTPIGCYRELIRMHREEGLDFSRVRAFNLDEYVGLPPEHTQSYRHYMDENLFSHVNIRMENTHVPDGMTGNPERTCREFEELIKASGGIDLQLLGIGGNGHIGLNEPGSPPHSRTRLVDLSEQTRRDNARFFKSIDEVPHQAISMGIGTIMNSKKIILLSNGSGKAEAVAKSIEGPITTDVPASILQKHSNCIFIPDRDAASKLKR